MRDVFEAIEQLSAVLAMRVEKAAGKRGWPCKATTRGISPTPGRQIHLINVTISLPQGIAIGITPRPEPAGDGWAIDVQRSDGVVRRSFAEGLRIGKSDDCYHIQHGGGTLLEEGLQALLDDLARPGPSGVALWVRKVWAIRFGRLPLEISEILDRSKDADRLDKMHAAVLRAADLQDAVAQLRSLST